MVWAVTEAVGSMMSVVQSLLKQVFGIEPDRYDIAAVVFVAAIVVFVYGWSH